MLKGLNIAKKYKRRKKIYKINPKQLENGNRNIYVNNYFICRWIKRSNQKTQTVLNGYKNKTHVYAT